MFDPFSSYDFAKSQEPDKKYGISNALIDPAEQFVTAETTTGISQESAISRGEAAHRGKRELTPLTDSAHRFIAVLLLRHNPPALVDLSSVARTWPRALAVRLLASLSIDTAVASYEALWGLRNTFYVAQLLRFAGLDDGTDDIVFRQLKALHERKPARAFTLRRAMEWEVRDTTLWPARKDWPEDPVERTVEIALAAEQDWANLSLPCKHHLPTPQEHPDHWAKHVDPLPVLILPDSIDCQAIDGLRACIEWLHLWRLDSTLANQVRAALPADLFETWLAALDATTDPQATCPMPRDLVLLEHLQEDSNSLSLLEIDALLKGVSDPVEDESLLDYDPKGRQSIRDAVTWWLDMALSSPTDQVQTGESDIDAPRLLAQRGGIALVQSAQGFLLTFRGRTWTQIAQQLKSFDAEEWHHAMPRNFRRELEGLDLEQLRDATEMLAALTPDAQACLDRTLLDVSGSNLEFYNLLHSTTPFRIRARLQALTVLPMLRWEFLGMDDNTDRVRRRIDAGKSVWEAFLEIHPGKTAILRRIAAAEAAPEAWRGDLARLLAILDPLPPEKVPVTELDWNAFHSIYLGLAFEGERNEQRLAVKMRWLEEAARMGWQMAYAKLAAVEGGLDALADIFDFLDEIGSAGDWLDAQAGREIPWENWRVESRQRWLRAPQALGMFRLLEASVRWHRILWTEAGLPEDSDTRRTTWPCLLPQPLALADGITAVSLGNAAELAEEGRRMQHCVGSYWRHCFLGGSHIVSLRDRQGDSLSTLEIRLPENGTRNCNIVQHRAYRNQTPSKNLLALEGRICAEVMQRADFKGLAKWRQGAEKIDASFGSYDFSETRMERLAGVLGLSRLKGLFPKG
jgi:hypothetical protein